jgi:sulfate transport system permease protein
MAGAGATLMAGVRSRTAAGRVSNQDAAWFKWTMITLAAGFLTLMLVLPLAVVVYEALSRGVETFWKAVVDKDALAAMRLTLLTVAFAVPLNLLFGVACAWAVAKFRFPGKSLFITLLDLPFSISPVIAGMIFVLLFGARGVLAGTLLGDWMVEHSIKIIFAPPGIILATIFVTVPFIARELIPLMQAQGREEEEAAISLGATGIKTFVRVTLPNIKWGLLYGVILCNARAMGEFGAVSVVSGHIRGKTNTMPLHVEVLNGEYQFAAAFAIAALLVLMAVLTLVAKSVVQWRAAREFARLACDTGAH